MADINDWLSDAIYLPDGRRTISGRQAGGHATPAYPPWRVETKRMLSPLWSSYASSPSSSQSASLIKTRIPGRL